VDLYLGELEQLVLLALARLDDNVYETLWRLEQKKFVSCWIADPTQERGGRRKKMYELNPLGKRALRQSLDGLRRMTEGLSKEFSRP
jgi:PadR family transcriptional regulator PadR